MKYSSVFFEFVSALSQSPRRPGRDFAKKTDIISNRYISFLSVSGFQAPAGSKFACTIQINDREPQPAALVRIHPESALRSQLANDHYGAH